MLHRTRLLPETLPTLSVNTWCQVLRGGWGAPRPLKMGSTPVMGQQTQGNQPVPLLCAGWGRTQRESTSPGEVGLESFKPCQQLVDAAPVIKAWAFLPCGAPGKAGF